MRASQAAAFVGHALLGYTASKPYWQTTRWQVFKPSHLRFFEPTGIATAKKIVLPWKILFGKTQSSFE
jgi:hypothetical protein